MSADPLTLGAPLLEVRGLSKSYGYRQILRGVNLSLKIGECVALKGENGAGKSTLLRILAGLSQEEAGQIFWRCLELNFRQNYVRSQIGFLGHAPALHGALNLEQHLGLAARLHGIMDPEGRVRSLIHSAGMETLASRPVREFSRGMQQRGALCRLWLPDPRLLLLDEPDAHLDDKGLTFLESLIAQRRAAHQAILLVTHRQDLISRWADRTLLLRQGTIHITSAASE